MTTLQRALNSIGKKCFVDNFEKFKHYTDKKSLAMALLKENQNASSYSAQITRINCAEWIFENNLTDDALNIILESKRIDTATKIRAKDLLSK